MTALSYSASPGGHYAEVTVSPGATDTFALYAGSYNGYDILPAYLAVSNTNNALPVTITFGDGSTAVIPPFSSSALICSGRRQARISNQGNNPIVITVFDAGHAKLYLDQYNSQPWQVPGSDNEIIVHFTETPVKNYGSGTKSITSLGSNTVLSTSGSPTGGGYITGGAMVDTIFSIETFDGVDFNGNYTIDFWIRDNPPFVAGHEILTIENGGLEITYSGVTGFFTINGGIVTTVAINDGTWHHLAMVKDGSGLNRVYIDGVLNVSGAAFSANINTWFWFLSGPTPATTGSTCSVSEVRIRSGAVWVSNFTPPSVPYT